MHFGTIAAVSRHCLAVLQERGLNGVYCQRLKFEISEISKQGADAYWLDIINGDTHFQSNPNGLLLPWLLGLVADDPLAGRDRVVTTTKYADIMAILASGEKLPPEIIRDPDNPDIDIDCLPEARDQIKAYATETYSKDIEDGYGAVCSVGTWNTYLLRSAIKDVSKATGLCDAREAELLTKELPDEVDDVKDDGRSSCKGCKTVHREAKCPKCGSFDTDTPTIGKLLEDHGDLKAFYDKHPRVIELAIRLVGRVRTIGKHAGALIIADRPLYGNIPMVFDSAQQQWKSIWSEGRETQLAKLGYTKWDILGLKNLRYIYEASRLIEQNYGISFGARSNAEFVFSPGLKVATPSMAGWDDINPAKGRAGYYLDRHGHKVVIDLNDKDVLQLATDQKTDAVFQFDTSLAKRILKNGVRSFFDLMILNAMGHPGPMASIPEYVKRRDDTSNSWMDNEDPMIVEILKETCGVLVYQEQLQALWQNIAGFTAPQAQEARKAVAKKWRDKLKPVEQQWLTGASKVIGQEKAKAMWGLMVTFGRYAFNRSHSVSYCLVAYRCLWLKKYFPHEWWAAVMSYCNSQKLVRYMNASRGEGVDFSPMDINKLTFSFTAVPDGEPRMRHTDPVKALITPGLVSLKNVGNKMASAFVDDAADDPDESVSGSADQALAEFVPDDQILSIDDFVAKKGKNKTLMERLIKLGSFSALPGHGNKKATWIYYQAKYCSGDGIVQLKADIRAKIMAAANWTTETIAAERQRQATEFKSIYPKRKVTKTIENWMPKPDITLEAVCACYTDDFTVEEILMAEEEFLGYHIHSPLELFVTKGNRTIEHAKYEGEIEAVIEDVFFTKTKKDKLMCRLTLSDGTQMATMILWSNDLEAMADTAWLRRGVGVRANVKWDQERSNFTLEFGRKLARLQRRKFKHED